MMLDIIRQRVLLITIALFTGLLLLVLATPLNPALAGGACTDNNTVAGGINCAGGQGNPNLTGPGGIITNLINALLFIAGAIGVLMLILGGLKFVTSQGNEKSITSAKNTILYAIIGLVVVILSYGIASFTIKGVGFGILG